MYCKRTYVLQNEKSTTFVVHTVHTMYTYTTSEQDYNDTKFITKMITMQNTGYKLSMLA